MRMCNIIATANFEFDRETHEKLLHMIVELYLTIRGYSYDSAWMEKYKQFTKNGIITLFNGTDTRVSLPWAIASS